MSEQSPFTVSPEWLESRLGQPGLAIIDASWYLPAQKRDARAEYDAAHIPGAVFFDHDLIVEPGTGLPHSLPNPKLFAQFAGSMGIAANDEIVIYDGLGLFSAPRAWWVFRTMGARKVSVLEGGFDRWKAAGRPVTAEPTKIAPCLFEASFAGERVAGIEDVRAAPAAGVQIVDARSAVRFSGAEPEPRPGMRSGHMPGATNLPFNELARDGALLAPDELREKFSAAGVDLSKPVVTSCGSGVTAAVLTLALETLGHSESRLYDGSWSEWGGRQDTEVVTGAERAGA